MTATDYPTTTDDTEYDERDWLFTCEFCGAAVRLYDPGLQTIAGWLAFHVDEACWRLAHGIITLSRLNPDDPTGLPARLPSGRQTDVPACTWEPEEVRRVVAP
jgi:hypothetical protein